MKESKDSIIAALEAANKEKDAVIAHIIDTGTEKEKQLLNEIRYLKSIILKGRK